MGPQTPRTDHYDDGVQWDTLRQWPRDLLHRQTATELHTLTLALTHTYTVTEATTFHVTLQQDSSLHKVFPSCLCSNATFLAIYKYVPQGHISTIYRYSLPSWPHGWEKENHIWNLATRVVITSFLSRMFVRCDAFVLWWRKGPSVVNSEKEVWCNCYNRIHKEGRQRKQDFCAFWSNELLFPQKCGIAWNLTDNLSCMWRLPRIPWVNLSQNIDL